LEFGILRRNVQIFEAFFFFLEKENSNGKRSSFSAASRAQKDNVKRFFAKREHDE